MIKYASGDGNDTIYGFNETDVLSITSGTYSTQTSGNDVIVKVGESKILLVDAKSKSLNINEENDTNLITLTDTDDMLRNCLFNVTINAGAGNDSITNFGSNVNINGGAGNDSVENWNGSSVSITGGKGNDSIILKYGSNITVDGGTGDDSIFSEVNNVTLSSGKGNDLVSLASAGQLIKYASGDGKDTVYGFNETDTLTITGGSYSTQTSGNDVIVTVGKGKILLVGAKGKNLNIDKTTTVKRITLTDTDDNFSNNFAKVTINAGMGNDNITNKGDGVTIDGGAGNDSLRNEGNYSSINGGKGNDYIWINRDISNVTIDGGAGEDKITNFGSYTTINAGEGNDEISNSGSDVTINAGAGNDYISNDGVSRVYIDAGEGDDTVFNTRVCW